MPQITCFFILEHAISSAPNAFETAIPFLIVAIAAFFGVVAFFIREKYKESKSAEILTKTVVAEIKALKDLAELMEMRGEISYYKNEAEKKVNQGKGGVRPIKILTLQTKTDPLPIVSSNLSKIGGMKGVIPESIAKIYTYSSELSSCLSILVNQTQNTGNPGFIWIDDNNMAVVVYEKIEVLYDDIIEEVGILTKEVDSFYPKN